MVVVVVVVVVAVKVTIIALGHVSQTLVVYPFMGLWLPGSAPEPYTWQSNIGYLYLFFRAHLCH